MGIDQVVGGLELSVVEWSDTGTRTPLLDGKVHGLSLDSVTAVVVLASQFGVRRALVDPMPEQQFAQQLLSINPEVFALQAGSEHNASSLADAAWRRMQGGPVVAAGEIDLGPRVVGIEPDLIDKDSVLARVYLPSGHPAVGHALIDLGGATVMERSDGSRLVEAVMPLHSVSLIEKLAPTTALPVRGWTLALSILNGAALLHEQVTTLNQMLGLKDLTYELARAGWEWIEQANITVGGTYLAKFVVYAGQVQVFEQDASDGTAMGLAAKLGGAADATSAWIASNAVTVEAQYPAVNLPYVQFESDAERAADTFDTEH